MSHIVTYFDQKAHGSTFNVFVPDRGNSTERGICLAQIRYLIAMEKRGEVQPGTAQTFANLTQVAHYRDKRCVMPKPPQVVAPS